MNLVVLTRTGLICCRGALVFRLNAVLPKTAALLTVMVSLFVGALPAQAQPDYPSAIWNPATCTKYYNSGNGHQFVVIHDMEMFYEAAVSYLNRCDLNTNGGFNVSASVYYLLNSVHNGSDEDGNVEGDPGDAPAGEITQSVRESKYAWHARCWNTWMFGTEHEGFVSSPAWYTETMYQTSANLQRYLCDKYGIPKDRNHIIGHNEWQNAAWRTYMTNNYPAIDPTCNDHTDPGPYWNWSYFIQLVSGVPRLTNQPPAASVADLGSNFVFSVGVAGPTPWAYQWRKNGVKIAGATTSSYALNNLQSSDAADYSVVVTNTYGASTSVIATLRVNPAWVTAFADDFETNSAARWNLYWAAVNGTSDFTTNWAFDYSATKFVSGGVTNFIPPAPSAGGSTRGLKLTVNKNDAVASASGLSLYPKSLGLSNNYSLRFDFWINYNGGAGGGSGSTEYGSWGLNHTGTRINWPLTGAASDGLWFAVDGEGGSGASDYRAYQGNAAGLPTQIAFANSGLGINGAITDNVSDPFWKSVFTSPTYETAGVPGKHWVQVEVSQVDNVITWLMNGVVIAQRTNATAFTGGDVMIGYFDPYSSIANPGADNFGIFDNVRVLIAAIPPAFVTQPSSLTVTQGANVTLTSAASGTPSPTYQWRLNSTNIAGATGSSYTLNNVQASAAGSYSVGVTNAAGGMVSTNAILAVLVPPVITLDPQSATTNEGASVTFTVAATGTAPLGFRWEFNGQGTAATGTSYTLNSLQAGDAGSYRCIVTNAVGSATSQVATLAINLRPYIVTPPQSLSLKAGTNASFAVAVGGTAPLTYQWKFNGANISGATDSLYTRLQIQTNDSGTYSVVITNVAGLASTNATLTVIPLLPLKFDAITLLPDHQIKLTLSGEPGSYAVTTASNLVDWAALTNITITNLPVELLDSAATSNASRYYRASPGP